MVQTLDGAADQLADDFGLVVRLVEFRLLDVGLVQGDVAPKRVRQFGCSHSADRLKSVRRYDRSIKSVPAFHCSNVPPFRASR